MRPERSRSDVGRGFSRCLRQFQLISYNAIESGFAQVSPERCQEGRSFPKLLEIWAGQVRDKVLSLITRAVEDTLGIGNTIHQRAGLHQQKAIMDQFAAHQHFSCLTTCCRVKAIWASDISSVNHEMIERDELFQIEAVRIYRDHHEDGPDPRLENGIE